VSSRPARPARPARRSPLVWVGLVVLLVIAAGGAYGLWYLFLQGPEPAPVGSLPLPSGSSSTTLTGGVDGTWKVDPSAGQTFVGYRVQEQLASVGANTAVGRTSEVTGSIAISGTKVTDGSFEADLTGLKSDDDRRDGQLSRQGIQTSRFPTATFKLTSPIDLGSVPGDGQEISATATGQLTLHGVTKDVSIQLKAKRSGGSIVVAGSLPIAWTDYAITKPNSFAVLSIADEGTMELQLFFTKG
jgi:polyisoprenoid-binding protein YceI